MVSDLSEFVQDHSIADPVVIGHSMGGKTAMNFALTHPDKVDRLIVVDISPKAYNLEHYAIVKGTACHPHRLNKITQRSRRDLSQHVPEPDVRQFLLKNLQRKSEGGFSWKINLKAINEKLRQRRSGPPRQRTVRETDSVYTRCEIQIRT
jgi:pimeloyl-ACP methyl ester carboxylesterase